MTNPTIVYQSKWNMGEILAFLGSGLKMMMKSGLEKIFLKFLYAQAIFFQFILLHRNEEFCMKWQRTTEVIMPKEK